MSNNDIWHTKSELDKIQLENDQGAVVRARSEKFLCGEQPTKRALADEKKHALSREILEIEYRGTISSDKTVIEGACFEYYSQLFGEKRTP